MAINPLIARGYQGGITNAFYESRDQAQETQRRNQLSDLRAQQMQNELDDDAEWDAAYARKDWDTLMRLDPQTTLTLRAYEQQKQMAGLEDVSITAKPVDEQAVFNRGMKEREFAADQQYRRQQLGLQYAQERRLAAAAEQTAGGTDNPLNLNDRQKSGINTQKDAILNYAANLTGKTRQEMDWIFAQQGAAGVAKAMREGGERLVQGRTAMALGKIPFIGDTIVNLANPDTIAPAAAGAAGVAAFNNPTGPITNSDVMMGSYQMPKPEYPLENQAQIAEQVLLQYEAAQGKPAVPVAPPAAPSSAGRVKVRSVQEAAKLPPGTEFETPDGQVRVRK